MNSAAQSQPNFNDLERQQEGLVMRPTANESEFSHTGAVQKVFVPHSEGLQQTTGVLGELVPFNLEYTCVRLLDGTYAFDVK